MEGGLQEREEGVDGCIRQGRLPRPGWWRQLLPALPWAPLHCALMHGVLLFSTYQVQDEKRMQTGHQYQNVRLCGGGLWLNPPPLFWTYQWWDKSRTKWRLWKRKWRVLAVSWGEAGCVNSRRAGVGETLGETSERLNKHSLPRPPNVKCQLLLVCYSPLTSKPSKSLLPFLFTSPATWDNMCVQLGWAEMKY